MNFKFQDDDICPACDNHLLEVEFVEKGNWIHAIAYCAHCDWHYDEWEEC